MPPHKPQKLRQLLTDPRERASQHTLWPAQLRAGDETVAAASTLYRADTNEWQAAACLLASYKRIAPPRSKTYRSW